MSTEPKCLVCGGWQNPDAMHTNTTDCINFIDRQLQLFQEIQLDQQREVARLTNIKDSIQKASQEPTAQIKDYVGLTPKIFEVVSKLDDIVKTSIQPSFKNLNGTFDKVVNKFFTSIDETVKVK